MYLFHQANMPIMQGKNVTQVLPCIKGIYFFKVPWCERDLLLNGFSSCMYSVSGIIMGPKPVAV